MHQWMSCSFFLRLLRRSSGPLVIVVPVLSLVLTWWVSAVGLMEAQRASGQSKGMEQAMNKLIQDVQYALRQLRKATGLHADGDFDPGPWHWGECGDFLHGACGAVAGPSGDRSEDAGACGRYGRLLREWRGRLRRTSTRCLLTTCISTFVTIHRSSSNCSDAGRVRLRRGHGAGAASRMRCQRRFGESLSQAITFKLLDCRLMPAGCWRRRMTLKAHPMAAVMSYQTWQRDYALDPSVVGSTFCTEYKSGDDHRDYARPDSTATA